MAPPPDKFLTLPGGRKICYAIYGDTSDTATGTIFFNHGLPGCHIEAQGYDAAARRHNLRIIAADRPGMGGSTPVPERRLLDWPADVLRLADALHVGQFAVVGVSGGAPFTLACLHAIPRTRCVGGGTVAGLYPTSLGLEGMMLPARILLGLASWSAWLAEKALDFDMSAAMRKAAGGNSAKLEKTLADNLKSRSEPDYAAWTQATNEERDIVVEDLRRGLAQGSAGAALEMHLDAQDWGFGLGELDLEERRLVIWHGEKDVNCPVGMARKANVLIKGSELRVSEKDAHLSISLGSINEVVKTMSGILNG